MKTYLFLTDIPSSVSAIENIAERSDHRVDYLLHSVSGNRPKQIDFRNTKKLNTISAEKGEIVFYLHGNLLVYVIENFLRLAQNRDIQIIVILSALSDFYSHPNNETRTAKAVENLLKNNLFNYKIIKPFIANNVYEKHLSEYNLKNGNFSISLNDFLIPDENIFSSAVSLSEKETHKNETIYLINEKIIHDIYGYQNLLKNNSLIFSISKLIANISPINTLMYQKINIIGAIIKFLENIDGLRTLEIIPIKQNTIIHNAEANNSIRSNEGIFNNSNK